MFFDWIFWFDRLIKCLKQKLIFYIIYDRKTIILGQLVIVVTVGLHAGPVEHHRLRNQPLGDSGGFCAPKAPRSPRTQLWETLLKSKYKVKILNSGILTTKAIQFIRKLNFHSYIFMMITLMQPHWMIYFYITKPLNVTEVKCIERHYSDWEQKASG